MPRFFFDIREEKRFTLDEDGAVFANAKDASEEALGILQDVVRFEIPIRPQSVLAVDMKDDRGKVLFTATLEMVSRWSD